MCSLHLVVVWLVYLSAIPTCLKTCLHHSLSSDVFSFSSCWWCVYQTLKDWGMKTCLHLATRHFILLCSLLLSVKLTNEDCMHERSVSSFHRYNRGIKRNSV